jgi:hypothetical protein
MSHLSEFNSGDLSRLSSDRIEKVERFSKKSYAEIVRHMSRWSNGLQAFVAPYAPEIRASPGQLCVLMYRGERVPAGSREESRQ